jgi:hypothetical protein
MQGEITENEGMRDGAWGMRKILNRAKQVKKSRFEDAFQFEAF